MLAVAADSPIQAAAADACLACAEGLAAAGKTDDAAVLCVVVRESIDALEKKDIPRHIKAAAILESFRLRGAQAKDALLKYLQSPDKVCFNAALIAVRQMPGAEVTDSLMALAPQLPPERQALLILAIGDRKDKDAAPASFFVVANKHPSLDVREAAIRVFAKRGDASALTILLDAALGEAKLASIARSGLIHLPSRDTDAAICVRLVGADAKAKVVLFDLIGVRQIVVAAPVVRAGLSDTERPVRLAALAAMAQLVDVAGLDLLLDKALAPQGDKEEIAAAKTALQTATRRMSDRDGCAAKLGERLEGASAANRSYLFESLRKVSGKKALTLVAAGAKSADPATKDAATRALGEWPDTDAADTLLDIAKNDREKKYRIRALRGYIRIARQLEIPWWMQSNAGETKLAMFDKAMAVARRDNEKQLALDILTRVPSTETLTRATAFLGNAALRDAAVDAALKIADQMIGNHPKEVASAMQKVIATGVKGDNANRAKQLLDRAKAASK